MGRRVIALVPELAAENREEFLNCLLAILQRRGYRTGSMAHRSAGVLHSTLHFLVDVAGQRVELDFRFELAPGNKTDRLHIECKDEIDSAALSDLGSSILTEARSLCKGTKRAFTIRSTYTYYGRPLDGLYELPGFRLRPADVGGEPSLDRGMPLPAVEQIVFIDVDIEAYGQEEAWQRAGDRLSAILPRLELILQRGFRQPTDAWRIIANGDSFARCRSGFDARMTSVTGKSTDIITSGKYVGDLLFVWAPRETTSLPPQTRAILRALDSAPEAIRDAFDGCARLLETSYCLPHRLASARLALKVAAVDALARYERQDAKFKSFAERFMPDMDAETRRRLWNSLRSGFLHSGHKHLHEFMRPTSMTDADGHERLDFAHNVHEQLRRGIIKWMEQVFGIKWDPSAAIDAAAVS